MTDNATPQPLSNARDPEAIVKDLFATNGLTGVSGELITEAAYCIRRLLKAQPAPKPLSDITEACRKAMADIDELQQAPRGGRETMLLNRETMLLNRIYTALHNVHCALKAQPAPVPLPLGDLNAMLSAQDRAGYEKGTDAARGFQTGWAMCCTWHNEVEDRTPPPPTLAEDEALIARFKEIVTFCNTMGPRGSISVNDLGTLCNILERLSLRSGHLAQVLALCDDAESTKQAKECIAGGGVICIQVPEIRAAIEGAK